MDPIHSTRGPKGLRRVALVALWAISLGACGPTDLTYGEIEAAKEQCQVQGTCGDWQFGR